MKDETTSDSDCIECPACGKVMTDICEHFGATDEDVKIECGWCEAPLTLSRMVTVDYTAKPRTP